MDKIQKFFYYGLIACGGIIGSIQHDYPNACYCLLIAILIKLDSIKVN